MDYLRGLVMKSDAVTVEGYILGLSEERREAVTTVRDGGLKRVGLVI